MKRTFLTTVFSIILCVPLSLAQESSAPSDDEAAIRASGKAYVEAFNRADASAVASFWSANAVYTDRVNGQQVVGRQAINDLFKDLFASPEKAKLDVSIESIQFVSPNVAVEHGQAKFLRPDIDPEAIEYSAVYVRSDGKWLLDNVTDKSSQAKQSGYEQLQAIEWMIGSWVDQDDDVRIATDCSWTKNKNFMTRSFTVSTADAVELSGLQIIGWDSAANQIRSWTFDSDGGFAEGVWSKSNDRWYIHKKGTTPDGKTTTAVNHVTPIDEDSFSFQSTQRTLAGELLPSINEVIVVRK